MQSSSRSSRLLNIALVRPLINEQLNSPFFLPLGLLCIAAPIRKAGHRVTIHDFEFEFRMQRLDISRDPIERMCEPLISEPFDLIGFTTLSDTVPLATLMAQRIKQARPERITVLGGAGTFGMLPGLMQRFPGVFDYVCPGEGELAFLDLVSQLACDVRRPRIPGLWQVSDSGSIEHCSRPLADLDTLPPPAYDLVPMKDYLRLASPRVFDLHIGSGCTYACKFCTTAPFWESTFRAKSPALILAELEQIHEAFGVTEVNFLHDNFANKKDYLNEFVDYFSQHNTKFRWGCAVRPDNLSLDMLARMKDAGCQALFCGTDSGSAKILKMMTKLTGTTKSYAFFANCLEVGIAFETNTIIGYPSEAPEDLEESLAIVYDAMAYGASSADISILQPLPGAAVTRKFAPYLVPIDAPQYGNFLPVQVSSLVESNRDLFSGFSFIHFENREFEYYARLAAPIRFFSRHFTQTVRLMKQLGVRYVEIAEHLSRLSPDQFTEGFMLFANRCEGSERERMLIRSAVAYEASVEVLRVTDVTAEIQNIYSPASALLSAGHAILDLECRIDEILRWDPGAGLDPDLLEARVLEPTSYLLHADESLNVLTVRLQPWQRQLWTDLGQERLPDSGMVDRLVQETGEQWGEVRSAVTSTADFFRRIRGDGAGAPR